MSGIMSTQEILSQVHHIQAVERKLREDAGDRSSAVFFTTPGTDQAEAQLKQDVEVIEGAREQAYAVLRSRVLDGFDFGAHVAGSFARALGG